MTGKEIHCLPCLHMKVAYPKVRFAIDGQRDVQAFFGFLHDAEYDGGRVFRWGVTDSYNEVELLRGRHNVYPRRSIEQFISAQYERHCVAMARSRQKYQRHWRAIEPTYQHLVDDLFPGLPWPKGLYTAFVTIWSVCPRNLNDKTFLVPLNGRWRKVNVIIAHEMLHFIYYHYLRRQRVPFLNDDMFLWHVTEIFNAIIQNSKMWLSVFRQPSYIYHEHRTIVRLLQRQHGAQLSLNPGALTKVIAAEVRKTRPIIGTI